MIGNDIGEVRSSCKVSESKFKVKKKHSKVKDQQRLRDNEHSSKRYKKKTVKKIKGYEAKAIK